MIFAHIQTIADAMRDADCIRWKVYDADENLMRHCNPPASTQTADSFNTLKAFLDGLAGDGYVLVVIFIRKATEEDANGRTRMKKGGDTANSSFSFYYKIGSQDARPAITHQGNTAPGGDLLAKFYELQKQIELQQQNFEMQKLRDELKELKRNGNKGYFEEMAEAMARELYKEYKRDKGKPVAGTNSPGEEKAQHQETTEPLQDSERDAIKSCVRSAARVMAVSKKFGGNASDVAQGFESFAKLAETNPEALAQIMEQIKNVSGE